MEASLVASKGVKTSAPMLSPSGRTRFSLAAI